MMADSHDLIETGIVNLDMILGGGLPAYSLNMLAGPPGIGKTILTQQILFSIARANPGLKVIYMSTLSEPLVKVLRFVRRFEFYDQEIFEKQVVYRDLGIELSRMPLNEVTAVILAAVEAEDAVLLVLDSFKAIRDLT
ncbi:MAG: AAA family ATPase, partial [Caldilinea sp.]|nr:AAA family ATPase [Caldilinea sp.]